MSNSLKVNIKKKNEICTILDANLENYCGDVVCNLPGLEFLIPPYALKEIRRDGKAQKIDPQAVLIFNGSEQHVEVYHQSTARIKSVLLSSQFVTNLCEPLGIKAAELLFDDCEIVGNQEFEKLLKSLMAFSEETTQPSDLSVDCLASEIMVLALAGYRHTFSEQVQRGQNSGHFPSTVDRVKLVMRRHLDDSDFGMDKLAQGAGLSKFHMIRSFKQVTGISPAKYLIKMKMDIAKQRLLVSSQTVIALAGDLGFRDLSTFNKAFKRETGLSPSEFRRKSGSKKTAEF